MPTNRKRKKAQRNNRTKSWSGGLENVSGSVSSDAEHAPSKRVKLSDITNNPLRAPKVGSVL